MIKIKSKYDLLSVAIEMFPLLLLVWCDIGFQTTWTTPTVLPNYGSTLITLGLTLTPYLNGEACGQAK